MRKFLSQNFLSKARLQFFLIDNHKQLQTSKKWVQDDRTQILMSVQKKIVVGVSKSTYFVYNNIFHLIVHVRSMEKSCILSRNHIYRPQTKMREGSVFRGVCLSTGGSRSLSRGSLSEGSLSRGGLCPGRVSVQRGGGLCPRGSLCRGEGVSVQGGLCQGDPHMVMSGRWASYWNAFLSEKASVAFGSVQQWLMCLWLMRRVILY